MGTSLETQGVWWLPDSPDHKVGGWLTFDEVNGGTLTLGGTLRPPEWHDNALVDGSVQSVRVQHDSVDGRTYPMVHGQQGDKIFTLVSCFQSARQFGYMSGTETEKVTVNTILLGAWFENEEDLQFDRARVSLRHATAFVGQNGVASEYPFVDGDDDRYSVITAKTLPPIQVEVGDSKIAFTHVLEQEGDRFHDTTVKQRWRLDISVEGVQRIQGFLDVMSDMQDLITIASGSTADIEEFEFQHPELDESAGGKRIDGFRRNIPYLARWSQRSSHEHLVTKHEYYFRLDDLDGIDGLQRWLITAMQYRTELGRAMATRYSDTMFLEDRITNLCAALESLDAVRRGTSRDENFVDHIKQCAALAGTPFTDMLATSADDWAKHVKEIRHDLAHHRERLRANATPIEHVVSEQLFWLFVFCILRIAQAPPNVFESISKHPQIRWLKAEAERADGP
ncbi:hypothetical protein [Aeromicrobium ginsengisoli]|uniref:ApeA N-terminal domain-containing protein n=1 Tax=Aeromicrobium ginsengisoli TaxID=363867 RepID=A0A5M4FHD2_9ACTN|nr:hypothetical protein [Aeromicrobium ginsengisoli]KAA1399649.1 hypothetical protein ESP70_002490 [Aeromicrobium ginsengisoli]